MSNTFKEKKIKYNTYLDNNKNRINTTLDIKHKEIINNFNNIDNLLISKKNLLNKFNIELTNLNSILNKNINEKIIKRKSFLKNNIELLEVEILNLENRNDEINYYFNTVDILLDYYNNENKVNDNIIEINSILKNKNNNNKEFNNLYDKYVRVTKNINNKKKINLNFCNKCKIDKIIYANDSLIICPNCGDSEFFLMESEKSNYKDNLLEHKNYAYKRINHLSEILNQFQAKEITEINPKIYERIKEELNILRIYNYETLNYTNIKFILKKLKLNKYYEHINHIINNLNGIPPPSLSREQEENIKKMFKDIQKPFSLFRPKNRKNFLNYNYIIHKICELYEYDDFLPYFPLLKSRINLEEQDIVWEKICRYKNYEFIPSI